MLRSRSSHRLVDLATGWSSLSPWSSLPLPRSSPATLLGFAKATPFEPRDWHLSNDVYVRPRSKGADLCVCAPGRTRTCCLEDNCQSSAQTGPVGSSQVRLGDDSVQSGLLGCSSVWWNDCETARGSVMIRAAMVAVGVTLGMTDPGGVLRGLVHPPLPERPGTGAAGLIRSLTTR